MKRELEVRRSSNVGFTSPYMISSILPYRSTAATSRTISNKSGTQQVIIEGALFGIPYGRYARLVFAYIISQAVHNNQAYKKGEMSEDEARKIDLGSTFTEFLSKIGIPKGAKTSKQVFEQVRRISALSVSAWRSENTADNVTHEEKTVGAMLSRHVEFWHSSKYPNQKTLFGNSYIELTHEFFELANERPVPFDFDTLVKLRSPLAMDLYLWATWHSSFQREIKYFEPFSSVADRTDLSSSSYREKIERAVEQVREAWGDDCPLNIYDEGHGKAGITLFQGKSHITKREGNHGA